MLKIVRNILFFRNVTCHWNPHTNICITCTKNIERRAHFVQCDTHNLLLEKAVTEMEKEGLVKDFSTTRPFISHNLYCWLTQCIQ